MSRYEINVFFLEKKLFRTIKSEVGGAAVVAPRKAHFVFSGSIIAGYLTQTIKPNGE